MRRGLTRDERDALKAEVDRRLRKKLDSERTQDTVRSLLSKESVRTRAGASLDALLRYAESRDLEVEHALAALLALGVREDPDTGRLSLPLTDSEGAPSPTPRRSSSRKHTGPPVVRQPRRQA
jgi:hypothetical protein